MNRSKRAKLGQETVEILEAGQYVNAAGKTVELRAALDAMKQGTKLYRPAGLPELAARAKEAMSTGEPHETRFEVHNETTLEAARRLAADSETSVFVLNFASAKNPGGGFLGGSAAQEESLARSSGLYASLRSQPGYYEANRAFGNSLYTDHMIYSPAVPVFRDDEGQLLDAPYAVTMLTSPAANAGAVRHNSPSDAGQIIPVMRSRTETVLNAAAANGHRTLVLGAWGCGVFKNDPTAVAGLFADCLRGPFAGAFALVVFAVLDGSAGKIIAPFQQQFVT